MTEGYQRYVHYDRELEAAVLGACMLEKTAFSRVHGILKPAVFYSTGNQLVYECMNFMWEQNFPIDVLTVSQRLGKNGHAEVEGDNVSYYTTKLTNAVVSSAHLEYHSLILRQLYAERELARIRTESHEGDVLDRAKKIQDEIQALFTIKTANDWQDMSTVLFDMYRHMQEVQGMDYIGVPFGFKKLDIITGGAVKSQLIAIGARPGAGKSAFAAAISLNAAQHGKKIGIISLEMPGMQIGARMSSIYSGIDFYKIFRNKLNEEESRSLYSYVQQIVSLPIFISDKAQVDIYDIRAKAQKLMTKEGLDLLIIDYLQLIEGSGEKSYSREQEVSRLSRGLKLMAMEYNIPVIVLCQLNRESEKSAGKKPQLHHLRESGSIEQDCDGVLFIHSDWKSGILQNADGSSTENEATIIIAKWRNGETAEIKIGFDGPKMKFYDKDKQGAMMFTGSWSPIKED